MSEQKLDDHLSALRSEISSLDDSDAEARGKLLELAHEIEMKLEGSGTIEGGLADDLRDAIREYEVEHPRATGVLNQILMTLSNMGI